MRWTWNSARWTLRSWPFCPAADDPDLSQTETYLAFSPDGATMVGTCGVQILVRLQLQSPRSRPPCDRERAFGTSDPKLSANVLAPAASSSFAGVRRALAWWASRLSRPHGKVAASAHAGGAGPAATAWLVGRRDRPSRGEMTEASLGGVARLCSTLAVGADGSATFWDTKSYPPLEGLQLP